MSGQGQQRNNKRYKCGYCPNSVFDDIVKLKNHIVSDHRNAGTNNAASKASSSNSVKSAPAAAKVNVPTTKSLQCEKCERTFEKMDEKMKHDRQSKQGVVLICQVCFKRFCNNNDLELHNLQVHKAKVKSVTTVQQPKPQPKVLQIQSRPTVQPHKQSPNQTKKVFTEHKCKYCNKVFASVGGLKVHEQLHDEGEKKAAAASANKNVTIPQIRKHSSRCKYCDQEFRTFDQLKSHIDSIHENPQMRNVGAQPPPQGPRKNSTPKFSCDLCEKTFESLPGLNRHKAQTHMSQLLPKNPTDLKTTPTSSKFKCDQCRKSFNNAVTLENHKLEAHLKTPKINLRRLDTAEYKCDICAKIFVTPQGLKAHVISGHSTNNVVVPKEKEVSSKGETCPKCRQKDNGTPMICCDECDDW